MPRSRSVIRCTTRRVARSEVRRRPGVAWCTRRRCVAQGGFSPSRRTPRCVVARRAMGRSAVRDHLAAPIHAISERDAVCPGLVS